MREKKDFWFYTGIWTVAVMILIAFLLQSIGDARIINYSGIVRGATQKLVKEEMNGHQDDVLISRLDGIIYDLQTGQGDYFLAKSGSKDFQNQLRQLNEIWGSVKMEIYRVRSDQVSSDQLFELSQQHFDMADQMVLCAEKYSNTKLVRSIVIYFIILALSITIFIIIRRRSRRALEKSLYTDNLTGILNRAGFEAKTDSLLRQRTSSGYTIVELDIDDFKFINHTYGYKFGDELLISIARGLSEHYHTDQISARIDADDFVILAKQDDMLIEDLREVLMAATRNDLIIDTSDFISFTIGAYEIHQDGELIQSMMDKANMAHKSAKSHGKSIAMWYNQTLLEKLQKENRLSNQMHRALADEEFKMYLQPKCDMKTMEVIGAEALVRWELPEYGLIFPDDFIPLFEKNGSIAELDFYMLEKACAYLTRRREMGCADITVSVNFSRATIYHRGFYASFTEIVSRYPIPHMCIEIEVTESAFNEIADSVVQVLVRLHEDGFLVSMDDFGAGYSCLNLLDKLPIQILKLDRAFLRECRESERVKGVISCVVDLAHRLGIEVICEGIETEENVRFLKEIGCDFGQGYYLSKPIPQEEFSMRYDHGEKITE